MNRGVRREDFPRLPLGAASALVRSTSRRDGELRIPLRRVNLNASPRDCFRRRLNFISGPFLTSAGAGDKSTGLNQTRFASRAARGGKSNLGSGRGEILEARAESGAPASKWKTNHSEKFRCRARRRTGRACRPRGSSPFIFAGL